MTQDKVLDAINALKDGQGEFKESIQLLGFEQKEIRKDVRALVKHAERQNGSISELQTKEIRRAEREGIADKSSNNLWRFIGAGIAGMGAILAAAEGLRTL